MNLFFWLFFFLYFISWKRKQTKISFARVFLSLSLHFCCANMLYCDQCNKLHFGIKSSYTLKRKIEQVFCMISGETLPYWGILGVCGRKPRPRTCQWVSISPWKFANGLRFWHQKLTEMGGFLVSRIKFVQNSVDRKFMSLRIGCILRNVWSRNGSILYKSDYIPPYK